ncbi:MAG TPA: hypothetical protein VFB19_15975 [Mycobacterium sp.]|nr:hypothetical protein [Mycobacterium sp.]
MRPSHAFARTLTIALTVCAFGLATGPSAVADPTDANQTDAQPAIPGASAPTAFTPGSPDARPAAADACKQFSAAMNYAATNYEDFAYASAGAGNYVNYGDPSVDSSNVTGRTALREAAGVALDASGTPGLQPEIANPMRTWSLDAAKLLVIMGVRGGGDSLNSAATDLNNDARNVQMACAAAGTRA